MRDDTHPVDAAPKVAGVCQGHRVCIRFCVESTPMRREFKEAELLCTEATYGILEDFARLLTCTCQPAYADRHRTPDDLLDAMVWVLLCNGITADEITRATIEAEEEYYEEAEEE
jgi:hypothetical protein